MSISLFKRLSVVAGIGLLGASSAVLAAPTCPETNDPSADYKCVFLNTGVNKYGAGTNTGAFYELGITGTLATSLYYLNGQGQIGNGSAVVDTNRQSVINAAGFVGNTNYTTLGATTTNINDTASTQQKNIDSLNALGGPVGNQGLNLDFGLGNALSGYELTYDYQFNGVLGPAGPSFTSGDLALYYRDLQTGASQQVLRVNINGSALNAANLDLLGSISFDFDNNGTNDCTTAFCQNFWNFQSGPQNWYSLAQQNVAISFHLDTNVNPPVPTADQLAIGGTPGVFARQTTLDSSVRFNVPEPGSLALVGLALVGLAGGTLRRSRKA
ncbi:PEP-CTERM sorting domain-containing protein [Aquabacterium sp.]|uniref:PEP-CTERM sorting domain-containing protein n=1 Tax=Aquabacterium sp. TaxID=1872578 RepID=UPI00378488BD